MLIVLICELVDLSLLGYQTFIVFLNSVIFLFTSGASGTTAVMYSLRDVRMVPFICGKFQVGTVKYIVEVLSNVNVQLCFLMVCFYTTSICVRMLYFFRN